MYVLEFLKCLGKTKIKLQLCIRYICDQMKMQSKQEISLSSVLWMRPARSIPMDTHDQISHVIALYLMSEGMKSPMKQEGILKPKQGGKDLYVINESVYCRVTDSKSLIQISDRIRGNFHSCPPHCPRAILTTLQLTQAIWVNAWKNKFSLKFMNGFLSLLGSSHQEREQIKHPFVQVGLIQQHLYSPVLTDVC